MGIEILEDKEHKKPDFKGELDVAAWVKTDKNGNSYLSIKIANYVNLFKNEPKKGRE